MIAYSQNDPRWKDLKINNTSSTMGRYGCYITSLAMCAGVTPDVALRKLTFSQDMVAGGFENIGLELVEKTNVYDNSKVLEYIKDNGFCIVRVDWDGSPKTNDTHFVVFIGDRKLIDPWDGLEKSTGAYPLLTGIRAVRRVMPTTGYYKGLDLNNPESMKTCVDIWHEVMVERLWTSNKELEVLFSKLGVDSVEEAVAEVSNRAEQVGRLKDQLSATEELKNKLMQQVEDKEGIIKVYEENRVELQAQIDDLAETIGEKNRLIAELEEKVKNGTVVLPEEPKLNYIQLVFKEIYERIFNK